MWWDRVWVKGIRKIWGGGENVKGNASAFKYLKAKERLKVLHAS